MTTTLAHLIETHGYWMLAIGCLLEGETLLILAGYAAHRGYLHPAAVLLIATVMAFAGDQAYFWLGRWRGQQLLARWPALGRNAQRVQALIARYHEWLIIGLRFAYGLRAAGPILMGTTALSAWRFALFNALGALLWAVLIGGVGWLFGQMAETLFAELHQIEHWLLLVVLVVAALTWVWHRRQR
jgi:membrane protein DedA with SNARE-associated domain